MVNNIIIDGCIFNVAHDDFDINEDITIHADKKERDILNKLAAKFKVNVALTRNGNLMFQNKAFLYIKEINLSENISTIKIDRDY